MRDVIVDHNHLIVRVMGIYMNFFMNILIPSLGKILFPQGNGFSPKISQFLGETRNVVT
jgi:hypothetical protein